jgi:uncharacterized membrane protein YfcA
VEILGALIAGSAIGSVLGFVGAGGAMLSVPLLVYLFDYPPHQASVAALAVVIVAALSGLYPRFKSREILVKEAVIIWARGSVANIGAANLVKHISDNILLTGFCAVIIFAAITMLQKPTQAHEKPIPFPILVLLSLLIGSITGLFGIGGGFLAVPILVLAFNTPHNKAAGTSLLIIVLNCSTALLAHYSSWRDINWSVPIFMGISALFVGQWAGKKSAKTNPVILRKSFAALLFAIAAFTLIETWLK